MAPPANTPNPTPQPSPTTAATESWLSELWERVKPWIEVPNQPNHIGHVPVPQEKPAPTRLLKAPQIGEHRNLLTLVGSDNKPDQSALTLHALINPINKLIAYAFWLFGGDGSEPDPDSRYTSKNEAYQGSPTGDPKKTLEKSDIDRLKLNIQLTGAMADTSASIMRSLHDDLKIVVHDDKFVVDNIFSLSELKAALDNFRDSVLPDNTVQADRNLTSYESTRTPNVAHWALNSLYRTVNDIHGGINDMVSTEGSFQRLISEIVDHANRMKEKKARPSQPLPGQSTAI